MEDNDVPPLRLMPAVNDFVYYQVLINLEAGHHTRTYYYGVLNGKL